MGRFRNVRRILRSILGADRVMMSLHRGARDGGSVSGGFKDGEFS